MALEKDEKDSHLFVCAILYKKKGIIPLVYNHRCGIGLCGDSEVLYHFFSLRVDRIFYFLGKEYPVSQ